MGSRRKEKSVIDQAKTKKPPKSRPTHTAGAAVYKCSHCKRAFNWRAESGWFGSLKDLDEQNPMIFACGKTCFDALQAILQYPEFPDDV